MHLSMFLELAIRYYMFLSLSLYHLPPLLFSFLFFNALYITQKPSFSFLNFLVLSHFIDSSLTSTKFIQKNSKPNTFFIIKDSIYDKELNFVSTSLSYKEKKCCNCSSQWLFLLFL